MNFFSFLNKKNRWSRETFGPGYRTERVIEHIEKEIEEIKKAPDDLSEWCDLILLATDGAYRRGYTSFQICCELERKLAINMARMWPPVTEGEVCEHVPESDDRAFIFLDIDGVLNDHVAHENGYNGLRADLVVKLNTAIKALPDAQVVLSSAWRYYVHSGLMSLQGLSELLMTHGLNCRERIHGITEPDPETYSPRDDNGEFNKDEWSKRGLRWRAQQIRAYVTKHQIQRFVVLDDLPLDMPELLQTNPALGLTDEHIQKLIAMRETR